MTKISHTLKITTLAIVLSFGLSFVYAWTAPTQSPPGGNTSAPINVGSADQTKVGDICTSKGGVTKCLSASQMQAPVITFTITPSIGFVQSGKVATIAWSATSVNPGTPCTATVGSTGWSGINKEATGSFTTGALSGVGGPIPYIYSLSCTGPGGSTLQSVTIQVLAPFSVTYSGNSGAWVSMPYGVTTIKIRAQGGGGGNGGNGCGTCGGGGGSASYAYYGAKIPLVVTGGGGGGAPLAGGGYAGYTGGGLHGGPGGIWMFGGSTAGNSVSGGNGSGWAGGGSGGDNATRSNGGTLSDGGNGGGGLSNNSYGGGAVGYYSAGGGGGLGGGGGGGVNVNHGGAGGGGSGYLSPVVSVADASGFVSLELSSIGGFPVSVYIFGGAGGSAGTGSSSGSGGSVTLTW